jgi:cytochrome d ubiquinol oxidase subunit II
MCCSTASTWASASCFRSREAEDRDTMMDSIAPVWDGNETWLVLGGGGLFAAFPLAYGVLAPAVYLPLILMLLALILRGVAFEFRLHGRKRGKAFWTAAFAGGSLMATVAQGLVLGGFIQGVTVRDGRFAGQPFDWLTPYSLLVAAGLVAGYALLGACWLVWKTKDELHGDARRWAWIAGGATGFCWRRSASHPVRASARGRALGVHGRTLHPRTCPAAPADPDSRRGGPADRCRRPAPERTRHALRRRGAGLPVGLPRPGGRLLPGHRALRHRLPAGGQRRQRPGLMLVGVAIMLPLILGYTAWVYWLFRGKVGGDEGYH